MPSLVKHVPYKTKYLKSYSYIPEYILNNNELIKVDKNEISDGKVNETYFENENNLNKLLIMNTDNLEEIELPVDEYWPC